MSKNLALEKIGRARVCYNLMQQGWKVGEALDDGYDILAYNHKHNKVIFIELKTMDKRNRRKGVNLTASVTKKEAESCTHIIAYVEPDGDFFIARKREVITNKGNIFASIRDDGSYRISKQNSKSFVNFKDAWAELLR